MEAAFAWNWNSEDIFISNFGFNGAFVVIVVAFYSYYLVLCSAWIIFARFFFVAFGWLNYLWYIFLSLGVDSFETIFFSYALNIIVIIFVSWMSFWVSLLSAFCKSIPGSIIFAFWYFNSIHICGLCVCGSFFSSSLRFVLRLTHPQLRPCHKYYCCQWLSEGTKHIFYVYFRTLFAHHFHNSFMLCCICCALTLPFHSHSFSSSIRVAVIVNKVAIYMGLKSLCV